MKTQNSMYRFTLPLALAALAAAPVLAQELPSEGPVPTTALITVTAKNGLPASTPLDPATLKLQVDRHDSPITAVVPVTPGSAQIAILIDDGLRGSFGLQLKDLQNFVGRLPQGTQVLVGYMQNGSVRTQGFTTNPQEAMAQLRVPLSAAGLSSSPYFCLSDFVKHWPSNRPGGRFVMMITNGVDPYNGRPSMMNQDSPYVQTAQEDAERAGVAVYSIYFPDAGMRFGSFSGQSYLSQVAQATGGESFYTGSIPPVSIGSYLDTFARAIAESYQVRFMASANREKKDTLVSIKLTTTQSGIKVVAPQNVHPGVNE